MNRFVCPRPMLLNSEVGMRGVVRLTAVHPRNIEIRIRIVFTKKVKVGTKKVCPFRTYNNFFEYKNK